MFKGWVILFAIALCYSVAANGQSLRGKIIYVSSSQPVKFKFGSRVINYSFIEPRQASLFKVSFSGKKNLTISSKPGDFKTAHLAIAEGSNSHLFTLKYTETLDASFEGYYDLSSTEKLAAEVQQINKPYAPLVKQTVLVSTPSSSTTNGENVKTNGENVKSAPVVANKPVPDNNSASKTKNISTTETQRLPVTTPAPGPVSQPKHTTPAPEPVPEPEHTSTPEEINTTDSYELLIHMGDSTAWIAKNYKASLRWYDSAARVNPKAAYPRKQIAAAKRVINDQLIAARQARSQKFNAAMADYKAADALRVERKFAEAYAGYSKFLSQIDTTNINEYLGSELHFINQANDYLARLQPYLPKPSPQAAPPAPADRKKKKKKKN